MEKHIYDVRGRQSSIFRLYCSDKEALIHMVFYRLAIIFAFLAAISIIASIYSNHNPLNPLTERFIFVVGVLMIPQLFESLKAAMLIASGGVVFGRLNPSFLKYGVKQKRIYQLYKLVPYIVTIVWILGLIWLGIMWSV